MINPNNILGYDPYQMKKKELLKKELLGDISKFPPVIYPVIGS